MCVDVVPVLTLEDDIHSDCRVPHLIIIKEEDKFFVIEGGLKSIVRVWLLYVDSVRPTGATLVILVLQECDVPTVSRLWEGEVEVLPDPCLLDSRDRSSVDLCIFTGTPKVAVNVEFHDCVIAGLPIDVHVVESDPDPLPMVDIDSMLRADIELHHIGGLVPR